MRIVIVEDQTILRESIVSVINAQSDMTVIAEFADAHNAIGPILKSAPDLVLMDVCTQNDSSGIVAAKRIKDANPAIRIMVITGMPEITFVKQARDAGVESFVYKNISAKEMVAIIRSTAEGYSTFPGAQPSKCDVCDALNDEEVAILRLVCETKSRKEIASELFLSEGTVKRRISEMLAKTGYDNVLKLAVHAVSGGFIVPNLHSGECDTDRP